MVTLNDDYPVLLVQKPAQTDIRAYPASCYGYSSVELCCAILTLQAVCSADRAEVSGTTVYHCGQTSKYLRTRLTETYNRTETPVGCRKAIELERSRRPRIQHY